MSPPITFADARRIVRDRLLDHWSATDGQLCVADHGYENDSHWQVLAGARPAPDDDDPDQIDRPAETYLVSKETGEVETLSVTDSAERLPGMAPYDPDP